VAANEELFGFFTGESWSDNVRGFKEFACGNKLIF